MMTNIPVTKLARSGVTGAALLKAGGLHLKHVAKRPFLSELAKKQSRDRLDDEAAQLLFETFTKLRGTALKIAQMLSMETSFLPDSFRNELSKSYHQVPSLGRPLVRKLMRQEFGQSAEKLFAAFDTKAFAAASLGQVHAARNSNGDELAVKLQYPGINVTIDNDMQLVRSLIKRSRQAQLLLSSLDEIEERLREEVNYQHEADNTEWFKQRLAIDNVIVPAVYREFSSQRILTTARFEGLHLEQWLQRNPSQESRDHFGQLLYDVFVYCFYELHALHADPNPGNYLFTENGHLGLLDFGCVRHFSAEFVELLPKLLCAYRDQDADSVINAYKKLGMVTELSEQESQLFYHKTLKPFGDWLAKPFKVEGFNFGSRKASSNTSYCAEGWEVMKQLTGVKKINNLANEFIFFDRTFIGLYQIFERLGATVRMQHRWLP